MRHSCKTSELLILLAKSDCARDHAHYQSNSTHRHDPGNDFANNINNSDVLHLAPLVIRSFQRPRMTRGARTRGRAPAAAQSAAAHRRPARIAWPRWDTAPVRAAPNDTLLVRGPDGHATDAAVIGRPAHSSATSVASASPAAGYGVTAAKVAVLAALVSCEVTARPARAVLSMAIHTVE